MGGLLLAAGIPHITTRGREDTGAALEHVCRDADVVINLLGARPDVARLAMDRPSGSVIEPGADHEHLLALPGLCRAIAASPGPLLDAECSAGLGLGDEGDVGMMSRFNTVLRAQVQDTARALSTAWRVGSDERANFYGARTAELLELASRHGIDTTGWVDPAVRAFATYQRG